MEPAKLIENWPDEDDINAGIAEKGVHYTETFYKKLKCKNITLTPEMAEKYKIVQKAHIELTGYSLPSDIKGAIKTRAQVRDDLGPQVKDEVIEKAVAGGLKARLAKMRGKK